MDWVPASQSGTTLPVYSRSLEAGGSLIQEVTLRIGLEPRRGMGGRSQRSQEGSEDLWPLATWRMVVWIIGSDHTSIPRGLGASYNQIHFSCESRGLEGSGKLK